MQQQFMQQQLLQAMQRQQQLQQAAGAPETAHGTPFNVM